MARSEIFTIAVITVVMAISIQQAFGLKCWSCSYDSRNPKLADFCKDHFDANSISNENKWAYQDCKDKSFHSVHCQKSVEIANNATVISRSCYYKPLNATKDQCITNSPTSVMTEFCGLCEVDGCNGATQISSIALPIAIIMAITKFLTN